MAKTVSEAIEYRRSVRKYKQNCIDEEKVKKCIENATLAPNSSNMQLWEFIHVTDKKTLKKLLIHVLIKMQQLLLKIWWYLLQGEINGDQEQTQNLNFLEDLFEKQSKQGIDVTKRRNLSRRYYKKIMPTIYSDFFGIVGVYKKILSMVIGLFRPIYREVLYSDLKVVTHKSVALAAQNFMLSMAEIGYDTCPMEGSDTKRVKKILNLPRKAEITMIIACGVRNDNGIYSPRFRVPFDEVYKKI